MGRGERDRGTTPGVNGRMKARRRERILDLIATHAIDTQEDLASRLQAAGFPVTQATVSRDIHDLRLIKVPAGAGRYRYARAAPVVPDLRVLRLFRECVIRYDASENIVVLHTLPATAAGVAEAVDAFGLSQVIGTLSGERTVFVVIKPKRAVPAVLERLRELLASPPDEGPPPAGRNSRGQGPG